MKQKRAPTKQLYFFSIKLIDADGRGAGMDDVVAEMLVFTTFQLKLYRQIDGVTNGWSLSLIHD